MRILVIGARGMLGHALVRACANDDMIAWDRKEIDVTDSGAIEAGISDIHPDVVINVAAYTNVDGAEDHADEAMAVNGKAVGHLAQACGKQNISLLHISTDYVFGNEDPNGYAEDAEPRDPLSVYGKSKLLGESLLRSHASAFWLVRTAWLYGPHGKNFVDTILQQARKKPELRVVDDQHGSPTYTEDLAQAIRALIHDHAPYGVYHLVNEGVATWADLAEEAIRVTGLSTRVVRIPASDYPLKAHRPQWSVLRNTKRPPLRSWQEALREYVQNVYSSF